MSDSLLHVAIVIYVPVFSSTCNVQYMINISVCMNLEKEWTNIKVIPDFGSVYSIPVNPEIVGRV